MYLLYRAGKHPAQDELWRYLDGDIINVHSHTRAETARMRDLMARYRNMPMDLADASLVAASEALLQEVVFSLDSDFYVYRKADGGTFTVIPGDVSRAGRRSR
jgi:predicted nucleic acid-binding protein